MRSNHLYLVFVGFNLIFNVAAAQISEEIRYTQTATIPFDWDALPKTSRAFTDTLTGDIIHQVRALDSIPLFYTKDIFTSVCFDNQCRPLNMTVYWNITGRYLGFKLPKDEFLSRYDHEPFTLEDYEHLNALLTDPYLPLDNISFEALIERSTEDQDSIDGVSGATSTSLSAFVVKGAAYTTYTLWNIIYGPTRALLRNQTAQEITPHLLTLILESPSSDDRIWGLDLMDTFIDLDAHLTEALLENIRSEQYFVAYAAINAITSNHLNSESLQIQLFSIYDKVNYNLRKSIIEKLKESPTLSPDVIASSLVILKDLNGEQLGYILDLYNKHDIDNIDAHKAVADLLNSTKRFISQKVYNYLKNANGVDNEIIHELNRYEQAARQ